jgi:dTDP-L-rhamnose 4-epimerase
MIDRVLITGGAGFIGSYVADILCAAGHTVRVLDALVPQVHGERCLRPAYLHPDVELVHGDICDRTALRRALDGMDAVVHLAARVGVGQSMYRIGEYTEVNDLGTARLLEALTDRPVERLVVASSMSIYGEGLYRDPAGRLFASVRRHPSDIERGIWDPLGPDRRPLQPVRTPEDKPPSLESIYALGKYQQEQSCLIVGRAYGIPTVALRLFNVYGPCQALSNPYTGVLTSFAVRYLNGRRPILFEDGRQRRDFVHVRDVAEAFRLALVRSEALWEVFNVGSGNDLSVREVAERVGEVLGEEELVPEETGEYRAGDIRHCFADVTKARSLLGFEPRVSFAEGMAEMGEWLRDSVAADRVGEARQELAVRGLVR